MKSAQCKINCNYSATSIQNLLNEYSKCGYLNSIPGANNEVMGFV